MAVASVVRGSRWLAVGSGDTPEGDTAAVDNEEADAAGDAEDAAVGIEDVREEEDNSEPAAVGGGCNNSGGDDIHTEEEGRHGHHHVPKSGPAVLPPVPAPLGNAMEAVDTP